MGITGGFGTLIDFVTGKPRRWYMRADGIRRWVSNDQPCDTANEADLWRCTVCGRTGTVGRCCGEETREPVRAPNAAPCAQSDLNLSCKSVQKRLATQWGDIRSEDGNNDKI